MINNVVLAGRLTADPELKEVGKEGKVVNFTLAVARSYKNEEGEHEADFIQCSIWNNLAENLKEYCKKGDMIGINGMIQTSSYDDKDGNKRYKTEVRVNRLYLFPSKRDGKDGE